MGSSRNLDTPLRKALTAVRSYPGLHDPERDPGFRALMDQGRAAIREFALELQTGGVPIQGAVDEYIVTVIHLNLEELSKAELKAELVSVVHDIREYVGDA